MDGRKEPASSSTSSRFDDAEESDGALSSVMSWTATPDSPSDSISTLTEDDFEVNGVLLQATLFASDELRNDQSRIEHQSEVQGHGASNHSPTRAPTLTSDDYWNYQRGQLHGLQGTGILEARFGALKATSQVPNEPRHDNISIMQDSDFSMSSVQTSLRFPGIVEIIRLLWGALSSQREDDGLEYVQSKT
jgi:hypothetical protein